MQTIKVHTLKSSSTENCFIIETMEESLILDAGISSTKIKQYISKNNIINPKNMIITHEHLDHVVGIDFPVTIYSSYGTLVVTKRSGEILKKNSWTQIKGTNFKVMAIPSIHNALDPVVLVIKYKNKKIVYFTDTEYFENKEFKNANIFLIESNYGNEILLQDSRKTKHETKIINHMSLNNAERFARKYAGRKTKYVQFIHLSNSTNTFELLDDFIKTNTNNKIKFNYIKPGFSHIEKIEA